jgi:hypothetical protein
MLGLSYVLLVFLTDIPLKCFTSASIYGMKVDVTGAHILLSLSPLFPDTGTGSDDFNRTYIGPIGQPLSKQTSQRLTPLHTLSPLILSYAPPCRLLRPSPEKYADIR